MMTTTFEDLEVLPRRPGQGPRARGARRLAGTACRFALIPLRAQVRSCREWRAIARLEALDDHMLDDIGIARRQIAEVVRSRRTW